MTAPPVHVVGGGLAGSECAWQLARRGVAVVLHEMRPRPNEKVAEAQRRCHPFRSEIARLVCVLEGMGRPLRYVPPGELVEVTGTTVQRRYLLRPSRDLVEIIDGLLARCVRLHAVDVVEYVFLSNHFHLLAVARDSEALSDFMEYLNGNLAKEAGRLHDWREKFWGRRFRSIPVTDEEEAQVGRLRYLLEQGVKEGLVRSPLDWPGARGTRALLEGRLVTGVWFSRTAEYEARRRGESFRKYDHAEEESLNLVPLPCWAHLSPEEYRVRVCAMVKEIGFARDYAKFRADFREAAEDLKSGLRNPAFPVGSCPPGLPYVRSRAP